MVQFSEVWRSFGPGYCLDQPTYALRIAATNSRGSGMGRMNFHSATFAVTNSIVASYDAGTHGNPAVAPSNGPPNPKSKIGNHKSPIVAQRT